MPLSLKDIFNLPDAKRRRIRLVRRKQGKRKKIERPKRTKEQLAAYLRENNIRTLGQLTKQRKDGDPIPSDYRMAFPKWSDALNLAYGWEDRRYVNFDAEYIAKLMVQFGIRSGEEYRRARKLNPHVVPPESQVRAKFGGFKTLHAIARRYSTLATLNDYISFKRRLGHTPSVGECIDNDISIEKGVEFFGSKRSMDKFISLMERGKS
jgi:hypothetical protein